jgi:hypothetical protein
MKKVLISLALVAATQSAEATDYDAVAAAPGNHRVVLENDQVRVLQVEVAPSQTEPIHEHRWPSVMHIQSAQPAVDIRYAMRNGQMVEASRRNLPAGQPPAALWFPGEGLHAVQNLGMAPYRLLRVELKQPALNDR